MAPVFPLHGTRVMDTTPEQTARTTANQHRINIVWEGTQALIAIAVTFATLFVSAKLALGGVESAAFILLSNAFFLVVGFYFGRTNHARPQRPPV